MKALCLLLAISPDSIHTLYSRLDPQSLSQQLALHELYPDSPEGKEAIKRAQKLIGKLDPTLLSSLFDIVQQFAYHQLKDMRLSSDQLQLIEEIAAPLHKQESPWSEEEWLSSKEVDVSRGLLLSLFGQECREEIRSYEALIDLMALQILARTSLGALPREKIAAINHFLFDEMRFRFPPHSIHAKDIDLYTFLPSILDSRRAVCLGVSTIYLCIAQRLGLELEIVTPPGHIYLRYRDDKDCINIETTARGIDLPDHVYMGVATPTLQTRTKKEVVGLTFFNQASVLWQNGKFCEAVAAYEKARQTLPEDQVVQELLSYNYLLMGEEQKGRALLEPLCETSERSVVKDYLDGKTSIEGISAIFQQVDENRESILSKQQRIKDVLDNFPEFRGGWFHLGITWLQLGRMKEAHKALLKYHQLDNSDATTAYYLAMTSIERSDYNSSWEYLHKAEELAEGKPRALRDLRRALKREAPE